MKQLSAFILLGMLTACGGGGSGVKVDAEPGKPTHPETEVPAVTRLQVAETHADSILLRWGYAASAAQFEVYRDGNLLAAISGNLTSYQDSNLFSGQSYQYQVVALNASGQRSQPVSVTATVFNNHAPVIAVAPEFLTLTSSQSTGQPLHTFAATDSDGHNLSWSIAQPLNAPFSISADGVLTLKQSAANLGGKVYSLVIDVSDGFSVTSTSVGVGFIDMGNSAGQRGLLRQVYIGHTFDDTVDSLLAFNRFPNSPSSTSVEQQFKSPSNAGNNYGQRMSGFLLPPQTGEYTFWIASDDASQLFLSTDFSADNKQKIAEVNGWVGEDNWGAKAEQKSQSITLQAGQPYFIEALMVELAGGDHLSVAWTIPGGDRQLISGQYLRQPLDRQPPAAISDLSLVRTDEASVILEWSEPADNNAVSGYEVWKNGTLLSTLSAADLSETNIEINNLDGGQRYDFYLVAFDNAGNRSVASNVAAVMISDYTPPAAPANLAVSDVTTYSANISWSEPENGLLYRIFINDQLITTSATPEYTLRNLKPGQNYNVQVFSVDAAGNQSTSSAAETITTVAINTAAPYFKAEHFSALVSRDATAGQGVFQVRGYIDGNAPLNYQITAGNDTGLFSLSENGELTLTASAQNAAFSHTLTISADNGSSSASMQLTVLVLESSRFTQQGVNQQIWTNVSGSQVADIPLSAMPGEQNRLQNLSSPSDMGNNYGQRVRGFLKVPVTGSYSFWIASDDSSELRLSSDIDPAKAEVVARVTGYTNQDSWSNNNQVKTNIELLAGQLYYIEVLHKEGGGGDHMSVAWQGAGVAAKSQLTGDYLMPYSALYPSAPTVNKLVQSGFDNNGEQLTLSLNIPDDADGLQVFIYYGTTDAGDQISGWQKMFSPGALASGNQLISLPGIIPGENYFVRVEVRGPAGSSWSSVVPVSTQIIPAGKQAGEALPQTIDLSVEVNGNTKQLSFYKHSVRSPNYQLLTFDNRRQQQYQALVPMPEPRTYRGRVTNDPYQVVTGVIDAMGRMHISAWRGDGRAWGKVVDVSDLIDEQALGNSETQTEELQIQVSVPAAENNRYYVPQPGADFHNNLVRVSFKHEYNQFMNQAGGNVINSIAQMENHINETDYVWAQKTGLRWDVGRALIEVHGDSTAGNNQPRPAGTDATNFSIDFQDPVNGGYCWGGGDWVGCVANYTMNWGYTHEIGHNMGLGHGEQTDNNNQLQEPGTHMSNMQARKTTRRLQAGSKFKPARTLTDAMPPAAFKDYLSVYQDESASVAVLANDYDANGEELSIAAFDATTAQGGQVTQQGNLLRYTPPAGYIGVDQFTYTVTDGSLRTVGPVQIQVLRNGLTGDWNMEAITSDHNVTDASGDNNHLSALELSALSSGLALADVREASNSNHAMTMALMASAAKAEDALGHSLLPHKLDPGHKSFTASMWVKYNEISGARLLMGKSSNGPNNMEYGGWEIRSNGTAVEMQVNFRDRLMVNNQAVIRADNALSNGVWQHLVMVIDRDGGSESGELRGYLNGVALAEPVALPQGAGPIMAAMNSSGYGGGSPFRVGGHAHLNCSGEGNAKVCELAAGQAFDDVKIYHKALSEAEIQALSVR